MKIIISIFLILGISTNVAFTQKGFFKKKENNNVSKIPIKITKSKVAMYRGGKYFTYNVSDHGEAQTITFNIETKGVSSISKGDYLQILLSNKEVINLEVKDYNIAMSSRNVWLLKVEATLIDSKLSRLESSPMDGLRVIASQGYYDYVFKESIFFEEPSYVEVSNLYQ